MSAVIDKILTLSDPESIDELQKYLSSLKNDQVMLICQLLKYHIFHS